MELKYETMTGSQVEKPLELDTTASAEYVYYRKNVQQIEKKDESTGNVTKLWQYDEAKITRAEYQQKQIDDQAQALMELAELIGG